MLFRGDSGCLMHLFGHGIVCCGAVWTVFVFSVFVDVLPLSDNVMTLRLVESECPPASLTSATNNVSSLHDGGGLMNPGMHDAAATNIHHRYAPSTLSISVSTNIHNETV